MNGKTTVIQQEQVNSQLAFCAEIKAFWLEQNITPTA